MTPKLYWEDLRIIAISEEADALKALATFAGAGRLRRESTKHFDSNDVVMFVTAMGAALRHDGLPETAYWSAADSIGALRRSECRRNLGDSGTFEGVQCQLLGTSYR